MIEIMIPSLYILGIFSADLVGISFSLKVIPRLRIVGFESSTVSLDNLPWFGNGPFRDDGNHNVGILLHVVKHHVA